MLEATGCAAHANNRALALSRIDSIREGLQDVMHDITSLLAMAMRQARVKPA
ncbi:hypothetical protein MNNICLKF_01195 [Synechococcus sp. CBW1107]|jgi:hypothetical protein|nr:hypothetical protein MNNICLKF_01195 [Synechococcus sp. CBW1107]